MDSGIVPAWGTNWAWGVLLILPECYMASTATRERRRTLRYRNLLVCQMVQMKNKISGLLMEAGAMHAQPEDPAQLAASSAMPTRRSASRTEGTD